MMKKKIFPLVSIGFKVLASILTLALVSLFVILLIYKAIWYAVLFAGVVAALCLFAIILSFLNWIVVDNEKDQLIISTLKKKKINLSELLDIKIDTAHSVDKKKYCHIVFKFIDGTSYKILGYSTVFNYKSLYYTQKTLSKVLKYIEENHPDIPMVQQNGGINT